MGNWYRYDSLYSQSNVIVSEKLAGNLQPHGYYNCINQTFGIVFKYVDLERGELTIW